MVLLFVCLSLDGQDTRPITIKTGKPRQVSERYYVLRANKKVKHGAYEAYFHRTPAQLKAIKKGQDSLGRYLKIRGVYVNGKKHGRWTEYSKPGVVYAEGQYDRDKKVGIWRTAKADGEVMERYDFDNRKKLEPEINICLSYPPLARENGIQGTVKVEYRLNADCSISDVKVVQSVAGGCDAEAVRCLEKYFRYMREYGPPRVCEAKRDTFQVVFRLE
ncbi:MAG: hypothetical protein OHK0019_09910 [Saprospiraceae bacterium]